MWCRGAWVIDVEADPSAEHQLVIRCHSAGSRTFVSCNCLRTGKGSHTSHQAIWTASCVPAAVAWEKYQGWHAERGIRVAGPPPGALAWARASAGR